MKNKHHVVLTPNEPELIAFKKSLPQGHLSKTVEMIMNESLNDRVATIPMNFKIEPIIKDVHTKISLPEDLAQKFCKKFGCKKGNLTTAIKKEIKKCIQKNLNPEPDIYISSTKVKAIFAEFFNRVTQKKNSLNAGSEKSRLIEKDWLNAFDVMRNTVNQERSNI